MRVFAALVAEGSDAAGRLRDEILTRFVDLAGETRTEFENASRRLGDDPSGDSASAAVPPIES